MRKLLLLGFCLLCSLAFGQVRKTVTEFPIRYHFGDDPRWSDPDFDDSTWPTAQQGRVPGPGYMKARFISIRMRTAVPKNPFAMV